MEVQNLPWTKRVRRRRTTKRKPPAIPVEDGGLPEHHPLCSEKYLYPESVYLSDGIGEVPPWTDRFRLYDDDTYFSIEMMYIVGVILWVTLVGYLRILDNDPIVVFILLIPIFVYVLGMWSLSNVTIDDEEKLLASSYLSIGVLVIVPLLTWTHDRFGEETEVLQIMVIAIILAVMSLVDIWVSAKSLSLVRHFRSIIQVAALVLIIYVLYHIFLKKGNHLNPKGKAEIGGAKPTPEPSGSGIL